jgi:hypothetical protein
MVQPLHLAGMGFECIRCPLDRPRFGDMLSHDEGALIIANVVSDSTAPLLPGTICIIQDCHVDSSCSDYA